MDRTPQYIAMCEQATEVQGCWRQEYGDFIADPDHRIECWLPQSKGSGKMKCGFWVSRREKVIHLCRYTWLPRLDQLIEMAQVRHRRYEAVTQDFFDWTKKPYAGRPKAPGRYFNSLEQLWIAFVMSQKFGKYWKGDRWAGVSTLTDVS